VNNRRNLAMRLIIAKTGFARQADTVDHTEALKIVKDAIRGLGNAKVHSDPQPGEKRKTITVVTPLKGVSLSDSLSIRDGGERAQKMYGL
jgi:hypothetical protein